MSKKSKRDRKPNVPMYTGPVTPAATGGGGTPSTTTAIAASPRPVGRAESISADYTHVVSDLRRSVLLAGSLIVILVALSFFIK